MRLPILSAALVAALCVRAFAAEPESALDFGGLPIGSQVTSAPAGMTPGEGCIVRANYIDCEFAGTDGIYYRVYSTQLIRKEIRRDAGHFTAALPFGIAETDSAPAIKAKVEAAYDTRLIFRQADPSENRPLDVLTTGYVPINQLGTQFALTFVFDTAGALSAIDISVQSEAN